MLRSEAGEKTPQRASYTHWGAFPELQSSENSYFDAKWSGQNLRMP